MARDKTRRGHGEGSIYEYPAGSGRWFAALPTEDATGRRRTSRRMAGTEAAATRLLRQMRDDRERGMDATGGRQTVATFLGAWLETAAKPSVRISTYRGYEQHVRTHLAPPPFGRLRLEQLRAHHVDALLERMRQDGLAPATRQHVRATLRRALRYAQRQRWVSDNSAALSAPPRLPYTEIVPLTPEQARQLLGAVRGERLEALYTLAIAVGMRQGELLALRWTDVDLDERAIHVRGSLSWITGKPEIGDVKTSRSRRTIPLPQPIVETLRAHAARQDAEREHMGGVWDESWGLVFSHEDGTPLDGQRVTRRLQAIIRAENERTAAELGRPLIEGEGLPHQRFHDLRHACASLLLSQGVPLPEIQDTLGHASYNFTRQVYAHLSPQMRRNAADRMGAFLDG